MQSELKSCPFCGGEAVMQEPHWRDGNLCGVAPFCRVCGIKTPRYWPKRTGTAITAWNTRASDAEITRLTEALRAAEEREKGLRDALGATESAIAEYYRYWTGGEMRGSYDGKPERNGLWQALHKARQALAGAKP